MDALLADGLFPDRGSEVGLEILDAFLDDLLGCARTRRDQDRLDIAEPRVLNLGDPVDQVRRNAEPLAISASRRLFELFWLPRTSTRSACAASSRTASWRFWVA